MGYRADFDNIYCRSLQEPLPRHKKHQLNRKIRLYVAIPPAALKPPNTLTISPTGIGASVLATTQ